MFFVIPVTLPAMFVTTCTIQVVGTSIHTINIKRLGNACDRLISILYITNIDTFIGFEYQNNVNIKLSNASIIDL